MLSGASLVYSSDAAGAALVIPEPARGPTPKAGASVNSFAERKRQSESVDRPPRGKAMVAAAEDIDSRTAAGVGLDLDDKDG